MKDKDQFKVAQDKVAQDKVAQDKVAQDKVAQDKVAQDKVAQDKVAQDKGIGDMISEQLKDFLYLDLFARRTASDIVSGNAKIVLYGLFTVVGLAVLLFALTITNDKFDKWEVKPQKEFWTGNITKAGEPLQAEERLEINQQLEQVNSIYIAAISGALALGGTLISHLWGRKDGV